MIGIDVPRIIDLLDTYDSHRSMTLLMFHGLFFPWIIFLYGFTSFGMIIDLSHGRFASHVSASHKGFVACCKIPNQFSGWIHDIHDHLLMKKFKQVQKVLCPKNTNTYSAPM